MNDIINGNGPGCTYLSIVKVGTGTANIVVGANFHNACASYFNKTSLQELIEILQEVANDLD